MENVILVNLQDEETGFMEKQEVHKKALLHRAFSVFIFNLEEEMLLQQRALKKYHSGGLWTNACCGHPRPGEETPAAAVRRLKEELGFETSLVKAFDFTYHADFDNGLSEYEYDHVFVGSYAGKILPDDEEVMEYCYKPLEEIAASLRSHPQKYTEWFHIAFPKILDWKNNRS